MTSVHVRIGKRHFVVKFDAAGQLNSIRERKTIVRYGVKQVFDYAYWHVNHHKIGGPNTIVSRILNGAKEKL